MKISRTLVAVVAAAAMVLPLACAAQSAPTTSSQSTATGHHHAGGMHGHAMDGITLTDDQKTQIQKLRSDYKASHGKGTTPDPDARRAFRQAMLNVLTPDQRSMYQANMKALRASRKSNAGAPAPTPTP